MVRLGDTVTIVESDSGTIATIGGKTIGIGKRVVSLPADGLSIAVRQFNTYAGDDGVSLPLPCGTRAFIPSEPPNYLPQSWEKGFGMSATQGTPTTQGWSCSSGCPINPTYHPTPEETCRRAYGLSMYYRNASACTHATGSGSWRANQYLHRDVLKTYWGCSQHCQVDGLKYNPRTNRNEVVKVPCPIYGTERTTMLNLINNNLYGNEPPGGCVYPNRRYRKRQEYLALDENGNLVAPFYSYSCNWPKTVCPLYNGGAGTPFPVCPIKSASAVGPADNFPTPSKPSGCAYHDHLSFLGWNIPGSTTTEGTSCVLEKATEGAANRSDDNIRCTFSYPTGSATLTGAGDLRLPISPTNLNGDGKAGTPLSASAAISIASEVDMDYTRIPTRKTQSGIACAFSQGRY